MKIFGLVNFSEVSKATCNAYTRTEFFSNASEMISNYRIENCGNPDIEALWMIFENAEQWISKGAKFQSESTAGCRRSVLFNRFLFSDSLVVVRMESASNQSDDFLF